MRIVFAGERALGEKVLKSLIERGEEVVGVCTPPGGAGAKVVEAAKAAGIPVLLFENVKSAQFIDAYRAMAPDLTVMAYVTKILPVEFFTIPTVGAIEWHPSIMPKHGGPNALNWPIIQGESKTGASIFWPDGGIDTGPILLTKEVDISPDDTVATVFGKLFPVSVAAMLEAVDMVKNGTAPRIAQDPSEVTYEGFCTAKDATIDWQLPARGVYDLIRGTNPAPGARTTVRGQDVVLLDSSLTPDDTGKTPGSVVSMSDAGVEIALNGGTLRVKGAAIPGTPPAGAGEVFGQLGIAPGDVLGK
jgi:methionyl-tRNA formyltransferase